MCLHVGVKVPTRKTIGDKIRMGVDAILDAEKTRQGCLPQSYAFRCPLCSSEYVVAMVEEEERAKLRVTRYMSLGDGVSPYRGEWKQLTSVSGFDTGAFERPRLEKLDIRNVRGGV